ncbi:hypothetical protein O1L55_37480 [Streptomyces albulus]|nr:hypothetical protein [Streptomyces noursei]
MTLGTGGLASLEDVPELVVATVPGSGDDVPGTVHERTAWALGLIQAWLADERFAAARLVFVTDGAVSGDDLAAAAVWGLVASAQSEHPDRFALVDTPEADLPAALPGLLAAGDAQFLVRDDTVHLARLARLPAPDDATPASPPGTRTARR